MNKLPYIPPLLEVYAYRPERGYATSVAVDLDYRDYVLDNGEHRSLRTAEEITEYTQTDANGNTDYTTGTWETSWELWD